MRAYFAIALLVVVSAYAAPVPWKNCGGPKDILQVKTLDCSPYPPVKGQDLTIRFEGTLIDEIKRGGHYDLIVKFLGFDIFKMNGDVCDLSEEFSCPHPAGPVNISKSFNLPSFAPSGPYDVSVSAKSSNGTSIICAKLSLNINGLNEQPMPFMPPPAFPFPALPIGASLQTTFVGATPAPVGVSHQTRLMRRRVQSVPQPIGAWDYYP